MQKLRALASKLQTALLRRGRQVKINQYQHYSTKLQRMVTKFVVCERVEQDGDTKNVTVCETYQMADVVKALAARLNDGGGG